MRPMFRRAAKSIVVGRFALLPVGSFLFAVVLSWPVLAADPRTTTQNAALQLILDTAKSICAESISHGQHQDIRIKGSVPLPTGLSARLTDLGAVASVDFRSDQYEGVLSSEVFQVNEKIINCKLDVISKLVEKLLPSTGPSDSTATKSLEVTDDPGTIMGEIIEEVCRLRIGMSEINVKGECQHNSCNIQNETKILYSPYTVYLKPGFESVFYSPFKSEKKRESEIKTKWPSSVFSTKTPIPVESKFQFTGFPTEFTTRLSNCVEKMGSLLLERLKPYEVDRVLASLPEVKAADYNVVQHTLRELDFAALRLWYPKHLRSGSNSTIEATITPSVVLKTQSIAIDENRSDEEAQKTFSKVEAKISSWVSEALKNDQGDKLSWVSEALKNDQGDKLSIEFSFGEYQLLPLIKQDNNVSLASLRLVLDGVTVTPLTPEEQTLKPLQPRSWSWLLKPNSSGKQTLYISVQAKRTTGEQVSSVLPIALVVEESYVNRATNFLTTNWQWIAGTIIIPLSLFIWSRVMRARAQPDES
jgi:hypothetical protein